LVEQEALCNEYILSQKLNIAKEYSDLCDLSIKTEDRPGFKQLMNDLDTENNSMIIVNHLQVFGVTLSSSLKEKKNIHC
jgi:DNA invertase Pin-like site-specific DNA recombinase